MRLRRQWISWPRIRNSSTRSAKITVAICEVPDRTENLPSGSQVADDRETVRSTEIVQFHVEKTPEAVAFYKSVFLNAKVETINDFMATFELEGQRFNALNGGPKYKFNEAISFFISVESQEEVDYFWNRLIADGGEESKCGWLKDKFGLSWQVVPTALGRYLSDPDRKKADRAMQAMMKMQKIVIAELDKAYAG